MVVLSGAGAGVSAAAKRSAPVEDDARASEFSTRVCSSFSSARSTRERGGGRAQWTLVLRFAAALEPEWGTEHDLPN